MALEWRWITILPALDVAALAEIDTNRVGSRKSSRRILEPFFSRRTHACTYAPISSRADVPPKLPSLITSSGVRFGRKFGKSAKCNAFVALSRFGSKAFVAGVTPSPAARVTSIRIPLLRSSCWCKHYSIGQLLPNAQSEAFFNKSKRARCHSSTRS